MFTCKQGRKLCLLCGSHGAGHLPARPHDSLSRALWGQVSLSPCHGHLSGEGNGGPGINFRDALPGESRNSSTLSVVVKVSFFSPLLPFLSFFSPPSLSSSPKPSTELK